MEELSRSVGNCGVLDLLRCGLVAFRRAAFSLTLFWVLSNQCELCRAVEPNRVDGSVSRLKTLERQLLPGRPGVGGPRCAQMVDYYWDANPELESELKSARRKFSNLQDEHQRMVLIAGPAGVGKTFIKRGIYDGLPGDALWKFDARELWAAYRDLGFAEYKADLHHENTVFNKMLTLTNAGREHFCREVLKCKTSFVVVDSLDEIHPRDYVFVLRTLETLVQPSRPGFAQVVVFGRPFCFEAYWQLRQSAGVEASGTVRGYMLQKPEFRTTGDIQVSNWNFDSWKFGLCRRSGKSQHAFCFAEYQQWCERGFLCDGDFSDIIFDANQHITVEAREMLNRWVSDEPAVAAVFANLAANGMVRDILVNHLQKRQTFDDRKFMEQFLELWLKRDTRSDDRPSQIKPEYLDVYLDLLENVAVIYSPAVQADGSFSVGENDQVKVSFISGSIAVSVKDLLNRSGLVTADPFGEERGRVRFEPLWLHRFLISKHDRRLADGNVKQTPVAVR